MSIPANDLIGEVDLASRDLGERVDEWTRPAGRRRRPQLGGRHVERLVGVALSPRGRRPLARRLHLRRTQRAQPMREDATEPPGAVAGVAVGPQQVQVPDPVDVVGRFQLVAGVPVGEQRQPQLFVAVDEPRQALTAGGRRRQLLPRVVQLVQVDERRTVQVDVNEHVFPRAWRLHRCQRLQHPHPMTSDHGKSDAFAVAGSRAWNSLPDAIRRSLSPAVFRRSLKTYFYVQCFY